MSFPSGALWVIALLAAAAGAPSAGRAATPETGECDDSRFLGPGDGGIGAGAAAVRH